MNPISEIFRIIEHVKRNHGSFRTDILALRALAVILVMLSHFRIPGFQFGFIGVDIFFVISGFLITRVLYKDFVFSSVEDPSKSFLSLPSFYLRRIRRLLPAAITVIIAVNIISYFQFNSEARSDLFDNSKWSLLFLANVAFLRQESDYFQQNNDPSMLLHYWSLSVEEQFYFVWPLLFLLAASLHKLRIRNRNFRFDKRLLFLISLVTMLSFAYLQFGFRIAPIEAYFSIFTRAWELGVGAFFGVLAYHKKQEVGFSRLEIYFPLIGSICLAGFLITETNWANFIVFPTVATGFFLYAGQNASIAILNKNKVSKHLYSSVLFIGTISYSLYLVHWPILVIFDHYNLTEDTIARLSLFPLSIFVGYLLWKYVEIPFQSISLPKNGLWEKSMFNFVKKRKVLLGIVTFSVVGSLYVVTYPQVSSKLFYREPSFSVAALDPNIKKFADYQSNLVADIQGNTNEQRLENDSNSADTSAKLDQFQMENTALLENALKQSALNEFAKKSILQVEKDISPFENTSCSYQDVTIPPECSVGALSLERKRVALIGDSKMGHFAQPLIDYFKDKGWRVEPMVMDGCILSDPGLSLTKNCQERSNWITKNIASAKYDLVISAEWPTVFDAKYKRDFFQSIKQNAKNLIILQTNPKTPSPKQCMSRDFTYTIKCQTVDPDLISDWQAGLNFNASLRSENTYVIESQKWVCLQNLCPYASQDLLLTRDGSHLTYTHVKKLRGLIEATLDSLGPW